MKQAIGLLALMLLASPAMASDGRNGSDPSGGMDQQQQMEDQARQQHQAELDAHAEDLRREAMIAEIQAERARHDSGLGD